MTLYRILKYVTFVLGGIGLALFFWLLSKGDDAIKASPDLQESLLNPFLILTWVVFGIAVLSVLIFVFARLFSGNIKSILISIAAFVAVFLIAFISADSQSYELPNGTYVSRSEEHTSELQSRGHLVYGLPLELANEDRDAS